MEMKWMVKPQIFKVQFKIYFIVWKQRHYKGIKTIEERLKQTLQYGNEVCYEYENFDVYSLKQTLQYGNRISTVSNAKFAKQFKIDFIVWKYIVL